MVNRLFGSDLFRRHRRPVLLGVSSAVLAASAFPRQSLWPLIFIALVPYFLSIFSARTWRQVWITGIAMMIPYTLYGFHWVSFVASNFGGLPKPVAYLVLAAFCFIGELQWVLFALLLYGLKERVEGHFSKSQRLRNELAKALTYFILVPLLYVGLDWAYPKIFPNTLGHCLYAWFNLAQTAEWAGVYPLTAFIVAVNLVLFCVARALLAAGQRVWHRRVHERMRISASLPNLVSSLCFLLAFTLISVMSARWGGRRIAELLEIQSRFGRTVHLSGIQANIGDIDKLSSERGFEPAVQKVLATYREMTLDAIKDPKTTPDLVVWPETSYPFLYTHFRDPEANRNGSARDRWMSAFVRELGVPIYFGAYSSIGRRDFNTTFLVAPPFELLGEYKKSILLAFGEYVPLGPLGGFVQSLVPSIADFGRGQGPMVITLPTKHGPVLFAPQICYEGIFPEHSRKGALLGADILLNVTNDSWFGENSEAELHLLLTIFRSIELRRPMVRITNTGYSIQTDITGRVVATSKLFEPTIFNARVQLPSEGELWPSTPYLRRGDWFPMLAELVTLLALCWILFSEVKRRRVARHH